MFVSPTMATQLTERVRATLDGVDEVDPRRAYREAHRVLWSHLHVRVEDEAVALVVDAGLDLADAARILELPGSYVRELIDAELAADADAVPLRAAPEPVPTAPAPPAVPDAPAPAPPSDPAPPPVVAPPSELDAALAAVGAAPASSAARPTTHPTFTSRPATPPAPRASSTTPPLWPLAVGFLLVIALVIVMSSGFDRGDQAPPGCEDAPVTITESVVRSPGAPEAIGNGPPTFRESQEIELAFAFDRRAAEGPTDVIVAWFEDEAALYSAPFRLPADADTFALTFSELFRDPGDGYRVELRFGACTLATNEFRIVG